MKGRVKTYTTWSDDFLLLKEGMEVIIRHNNKNKYAVFMETSDDPSKTENVFKTNNAYINKKEIEAFLIIPKY